MNDIQFDWVIELSEACQELKDNGMYVFYTILDYEKPFIIMRMYANTPIILKYDYDDNCWFYKTVNDDIFHLLIAHQTSRVLKLNQFLKRIYKDMIF